MKKTVLRPYQLAVLRALRHRLLTGLATTVVVDEPHRAEDGAIVPVGAGMVVATTGTPQRADGVSLAEIFDRAGRGVMSMTASTQTLVLDAWMYARDIVELYDEHDAELPEVNVLSDHLKAAKLAERERTACVCGALNEPDARFCKACGAHVESSSNGRVTLTGFTWDGEGAWLGDPVLKEIAKKVHGRVDIVSMSHGQLAGARIEDGVLTDCVVVMTLQPRTTP